MNVAVMQPYVFPYLGYYQLLSAVDHFVVLDDVAFIKQGWINRNRILADGRPQRFTVPLTGAGSNVKIRDVEVSEARYPLWREKFRKSLTQSYGRAPQFDVVMALLEEVFPQDAPKLLIRDVAVKSLGAVMRHLGVELVCSPSSDYERPAGVRGTARILDLCRQIGATGYYNAPGGTGLYDEETFERHGIGLKFLVPRPVEYAQLRHPFVRDLSIIDALMFNPPSVVRSLLDEYDFT